MFSTPPHSIGFLDSEPLKETDEESEVNWKTSILTEEEREEIMQELAKVCAKLSKNGRGVAMAVC